MNVQILIPARYASSRYPGKPLVELRGASGMAKPLIHRSVEAARRVPGVSGVFVVTDDERIAEACLPARVGVIMTSPECRNGTERCAEALAQLHDADLVINFQGDALLTPPGFVEALASRGAALTELEVGNVTEDTGAHDRHCSPTCAANAPERSRGPSDGFSPPREPPHQICLVDFRQAREITK